MTTPAEPVTQPTSECDVVMKGGITSGVIYPTALAELSRTYRFRGLGGASAGAIGAALGAAAEHGRAAGGFAKLQALPGTLGNGALMRLFQAGRATRPMLRLMLAATSTKGGKVVPIVRAVLRSFPLWSLIGLAPGVAAIVFGARQDGMVRCVVIVLGGLAALIGWLLAVVARLYWVLTRKITGNNFGICTGLHDGERTPNNPGFTEWLADQIDGLAGRTAGGDPLTFGQLWTGSTQSTDVPARERVVDLRMVTTCLSEAQPFELPWVQRRYFFDAEEWATLFPRNVVQHLLATARRSDDADEDRRLASHRPALTRMPLAHDLPVIVATRMSLSFPLLISAIPMWTIDRRKNELVKVWFTDGGLCNNFPVQLFDAALPTRPTFAFNLGQFGTDSDEQEDERENVIWAKNNNSGIAPRVGAIPLTGMKAVTGFAGLAFNAARNWTDVSQLDQPGYRDRIAEVLQTKAQGGMNLNMQRGAIDRLATRGSAAASVLVDQFNQPHYKLGTASPFTGWDNHRWVRYRATIAALPDWLASFCRGAEVLQIDPRERTTQPSYELDESVAVVAERITDDLQALAAAIAASDQDAVRTLQSAPNPKTVLRRVPVL